jgi:dipeptidyl aminopeptidase/acylaminoacyl peptidase
VKRFLFSVGTLFVILSLACSIPGLSDGGKKNPPSASKSAMELKAVDRDEVEIEDSGILSFSPDGKWFLVQRGGDEICVLAAATLEEKDCVSWKYSIDTWNIAWSPDGKKVAFTEDAFYRLYESDLRVYEIEAGRVSNLTNDGLEGSFGDWEEWKESGKEINMDTTPAWSPDGKMLVFARTDVSQENRDTTLYTIKVDGGEPEKLLVADRDYPMSIWRGMQWTADGKKIVYTISANKRDALNNGIWVVDKDGKNPKHVLRVTEEMGPVLLLDVSAKGDKALIGYYQFAGLYATKTNLSYCALLDLKTGDVEPLKEASPEATEQNPEFSGLNDAIFSPDGSKILYYYTYTPLTKHEHRLVVRDVDGQEENILFTSEDGRPIGGLGMGTSLYWAANDTIFVVSMASQSYGTRFAWLITLGVK